MAQGKRTVSDEEIIQQMKQSSDPAFTTSEIAEMVGMTPAGMRGRLESLKESGQVSKKKPSTRTVIWWTETDHPSAVSVA